MLCCLLQQLGVVVRELFQHFGIEPLRVRVEFVDRLLDGSDGAQTRDLVGVIASLQPPAWGSETRSVKDRVGLTYKPPLHCVIL